MPWGVDEQKFIGALEAAGHKIARETSGEPVQTDSPPPEDHHTSVHCEVCWSCWCYWCREIIDPCDGPE